MSNDWIKHTGGPQPVGDDVWVELRDDHVPFDIHLAKWVVWGHALQYRILNQHLIDAARLEGIRLGLEAAANVAFQNFDWPHPVFKSIRNLNPDTIAEEAQRD